MALTKEQLAAEKANEAKLNQLSDQIIGYTPFGQLYPLMKMASQAGQGAIPHKICVDADGRSVKVYKGTTGQLIGSFLKPTHEYVTKYIAQKEYGKAFAASFGLFGQLTDVKNQQSATCITITPNEIVNLVNAVPSRDPNTGLRRAVTDSNGNVTPGTQTVTQQFFNSRNIIITLSVAAGVGILLGALKLAKVV